MELEKTDNNLAPVNMEMVLLSDIKSLINQTKNVVVMTANSALVMLY